MLVKAFARVVVAYFGQQCRLVAVWSRRQVRYCGPPQHHPSTPPAPPRTPQYPQASTRAHPQPKHHHPVAIWGSVSLFFRVHFSHKSFHRLYMISYQSYISPTLQLLKDFHWAHWHNFVLISATIHNHHDTTTTNNTHLAPPAKTPISKEAGRGVKNLRPKFLRGQFGLNLSWKISDDPPHSRPVLIPDIFWVVAVQKGRDAMVLF